jgi:hypothetical protein
MPCTLNGICRRSFPQPQLAPIGLGQCPCRSKARPDPQAGRAFFRLLAQLAGPSFSSASTIAHVFAPTALILLQTSDRQSARAHPSMLIHVTLPTIPSAVISRACWNAFTALSVLAPKTPSIAPGSWPRPALQNRFGHDESLRYTVVNSARDARVAPTPPAGTHHVRRPTTPSSGSACCAW